MAGADPRVDDLPTPQEFTLGPVSVSVRGVSVRFRTETSNIDELPRGRKFLGQLAQSFGMTTYTHITALDNVSFDVREGEHLGVLGANGSGKSTLLRVIAGVEPSAVGQVLASTTPVLLGVQAALLPNLTGARNVRLGLLALGYEPDEVETIMPEVIDLAGIGDAVHRPMNTYSSGMASRLRFAIAAAAEPSILLIDEALGTGDAAFAARSARTIERMRENAGTIFLVSHAAQTIERLCTRALWLHEGRIVTDGPAIEVARAYRWWAHNMSLEQYEVADGLVDKARRTVW